MLPNTYLPLEYLEATGTQYINTGLNERGFYKYEVEGLITDEVSAWISGYVDGTNRTGMLVKSGSVDYMWIANGYNTLSMPNIDNSKPRIVTQDRFGIRVEQGETVYTATYDGATTQQNIPLLIFKYGNDSTFNYGKIIECKISENNNLIRDYIPALRLSDNVAGLYDLVNDVFYTNAGTGTFKFAFRNDEEAYQVIKNCEYIQSSGTQYIDTEIIANRSNILDIDYMFLEYDYNDVPMGIYDGSVVNYPLYTENGLSIIVNNQGNVYDTYNTNRHNLHIDYETSQYKYDGVDGTLGQTLNNSNLTYYLFARNSSNSPTNYSITRIYSLKSTDKVSGVVNSNLIPVVMDDVGYLYDKVEHKLYGNNGSGTFTYGSLVEISVNPENTGWVDRDIVDGKLSLNAIANTGYKFVNWLLKGYTQLEYIESTGTQYIDTGYTTSVNTKVNCKFQKTANVDGCIFGSHWDTKAILFHYDTTGLLTGYYGSGINAYVNINTDVVVEMLPNNYIINGVSHTTTGSPSRFGPLKIFMSSNNYNSYYSKIKLYYFQQYDGDTLVRDFIPVIRHSDGAIGLLDLVNLKFYGNSGTGEFIGGNAV